VATPPTMPVAPPIAAPRAAPGPPPAAAPMAAPEAAPITPPPRPRCTGSYGFVQADRPNTNAAMTHGTVRVTIVSVRSSTGPNRQRQRIHRTLSLRESSASALRAQRACSGTSRKNLLAEPVRGGLAETVKTLSKTGMAHQRASEWLRNPRISHPVGLYSRRGGAEPWKRIPSNKSSRRSSQPMSKATAASSGELKSPAKGHEPDPPSCCYPCRGARVTTRLSPQSSCGPSGWLTQ